MIMTPSGCGGWCRGVNRVYTPGNRPTGLNPMAVNGAGRMSLIWGLSAGNFSPPHRPIAYDTGGVKPPYRFIIQPDPITPTPFLSGKPGNQTVMTTPTHPVTKADIRRAIGEPDFGRGRQYFADGLVLGVRYRQGAIFGEVAGNYESRYEQKIHMAFDRRGRLREVNGECTCPVGYNCKHVAAVLLAARKSWPPAAAGKGSEAGGRATLPPPLRSWLKTVSASVTGNHPAQNVGDGSRGRQGKQGKSARRICFVFERHPRGFASIKLFDAYIKKDGNPGASAKQRIIEEIDMSQHMSATDAALVARLGYYMDGVYDGDFDFYHDRLPTPRWPDGEELAAFIRDITQSGHAYVGDIHGPRARLTPPRQLTLEWQRDEDGVWRPVAHGDDGQTLELLPVPTPYYMDPYSGAVGVAKLDLAAPVAVALSAAPEVPAEAAAGVASALKAMAASPESELPSPMADGEQQELGKPRPLLRLYGVTHRGRHYPCARLYVTYDGATERLNPGQGAAVVRFTHAGKPIAIARDLLLEEELVEELLDIGDAFSAFEHDMARARGLASKHIPDAGLGFPPSVGKAERQTDEAFLFTVQAVPVLRLQGWQVDIADSWPFHFVDGRGALSVDMEPDPDGWFSLSARVDIDGQSADIASLILQFIEQLPVDANGKIAADVDLKTLAAQTNLYAQLPGGGLATVEGKRLLPFIEAFLEDPFYGVFHRAEAGRVAKLARTLEGHGITWRGGAELLELGEKLQRLTDARADPAPAGFRGELRPYQQIGYGWLRALATCGFGGVLADDMGLGKTVQALCLLAWRHLEANTDRPSLLIAPTSLLGNWRREAARFAPELRLITLHGPERAKLFRNIPDHHLALTTYPLVNRDHERLFAYEYDTVILDEAQAVKNPAAVVSKRIRAVKARQRLALTGTPVENNLGELWALYDWLIPGLLGERWNFNDHYRKPIEQDGDPARQRMLSTRLKPFLLRRDKEQVARELPPKTEIDDMIPLEGGQAALYENIRSAMDTRVREAVTAKGIAGSRITILDALLKLRQVCCDPALVKLDSARAVKTSAKRARLMQLLEELMAEGRKVLVFSQFVEMLRLIEADVGERGWPYAMLHGQTRQRDAAIERFQHGDAALFLISLKAGGLGLNLTAADTVILYDPWWNPAVERQAMDRAHRIGQDKPVFAHRLIAENTVEAAIHKLQAQKQALADALFEGTGKGPTALTQEDLDMLLGGEVAPSSAR